MYLELLLEGYDNIKIVGVNGFQYINDSYNCMICDTPEDCTNCSEFRILPWVQDLDSNEDGSGDVWNNWDITLRDLVIISSNGNYITRINLTGNNPDPSNDCGNIYYELIKNLLIENR